MDDHAPPRTRRVVFAIVATAATIVGTLSVVGVSSAQRPANAAVSHLATAPHTPSSVPSLLVRPHVTTPVVATANVSTPTPTPTGACFDGEPPLAADVSKTPVELLRCAALASPDETALVAAAVAAPYDAVGFAANLEGLPGGSAAIAQALSPDTLMRALGDGLDYFGSRNDLRGRLPRPLAAALSNAAGHALASAMDTAPSETAGRIADLLDDMVDAPSDERFMSVEALSAAQVFALAARGMDGAYTSTFDGVFSHLVRKMRMERLSFAALAARPGGAEAWGHFVAVSVAHGRGRDMFAAADAATLAAPTVAALLAGGPGFDGPLAASALADSVSAAGPAARVALEDAVAERHRNSTGDVRRAAGLAASLYLIHAGRERHTPAFVAEHFAEHYPVPALPQLDAARMLPDGVNLQRMVFYNDPDGQDSFRDFLRRHRAPNWDVADHGGFVVVASAPHGGRQVVVAANRPWAGASGQADLEGWLAGRVPNVIVHRGHSYHEEETLPRIGAKTALVFWGSCGGHQRLRDTLARAPEAAVVATQDIGDTGINDAILQAIDDRLLADGTLSWERVWAQAKATNGGKRFAAYRRPDQDTALLALRAWATPVN